MQEYRKNRYEIWWYRTFEVVFVLPFILCILPIPLMLPIGIIGMTIEQPEEMPFAIFFFSWLIIGMGIVTYMEKKH